MLFIQPKIAKAIHENRAIVALESTIISHGMPYPQNVETALAVEAEVRAAGAIPATIAIMDGMLKVGLSTAELEHLGKTGQKAIKCSRRDLPFVLAKKMTGATTVAATMIIAEMAGIHIFATGGIGGVHRDAGQTMDISADLQELAKTNVVVVCAGAKSILDIGLTLEYLETQGVPVIGYQTDEFPAFFMRSSGFGVDYRLDSPKEIAQALKIKWTLPLKGGVVVANPVPEEYEADNKLIQKAIEIALADADEQGVSGKEITPFLLARIEALTAGASLKSNIQLVLNNARLAAAIAVEMTSI
jgi:pseudouridine-5'-phosphate glycosidase